MVAKKEVLENTYISLLIFIFMGGAPRRASALRRMRRLRVTRRESMTLVFEDDIPRTSFQSVDLSYENIKHFKSEDNFQ